jgi:hypothetical protein
LTVVFPVSGNTLVVLVGEGVILEHRGGRVSDLGLNKKGGRDRSSDLTTRRQWRPRFKWYWRRSGVPHRSKLIPVAPGRQRDREGHADSTESAQRRGSLEMGKMAAAARILVATTSIRQREWTVVTGVRRGPLRAIARERNSVGERKGGDSGARPLLKPARW